MFPVSVHSYSSEDPFCSRIHAGSKFSIIINCYAYSNPTLLTSGEYPTLVILFRRRSMPIIRFMNSVDVFRDFFGVKCRFPKYILSDGMAFCICFAAFRGSRVVNLVFGLDSRLTS